MQNRKTYIISGSLLILTVLVSFVSDDSIFRITKKDVELNIPKGFPDPVYSFKDNKLEPDIFVLGRELFHDPILSFDSTTSCSSCHQRFAAFAHIDHRLGHGIKGGIGNRNVPALQNLIWKKELMADGAINNLEVQALAPITNPLEMGETIEHVIEKLQQNERYVALFKEAFDDTTVTSERMLKAITQFVGLMISDNSRYDKYVRGEDTLSKHELNGLALFRVHCVSCHKEPLLTDNSYRNIGLEPDSTLKDAGRSAITGSQADYMKFMVPGLRNVEMTYPYMHDGRFKNLKQVMDHYANGVFFTDNVDPAVRNNVGLSEDEKTDIIAFLKALTDKEFKYDRRFIDPNVERTIEARQNTGNN